MLARVKTVLAVAAGLSLLAVAGAAAAQCCAKPPPPPVCCKPPPPPPPPKNPPCCNGGHTIKVPNINVVVAAPVIAIAKSSATAISSSGAVAGSGAFGLSSGQTFIGGGGGWFVDSGQPSLLQGLNVEAAAEAVAEVRRVPYTETRRRTRKVVIRAVCIDDRMVPHPASQVRPDREIDESFEGELYRCLAGSRLQVTIAEWSGKISFDGGESMECKKGDALYHSPGGEIVCRRQRPARECNERSLLRRYGAGIKILTMTKVETFTAYREETVSVARASASAGASSIMLDGGVGGVIH
jgi:hypothetical protein